MLKLHEAKFVWTRIGVGAGWRMCTNVVSKNRVGISRLRGAESVMSQCGKFEFMRLVTTIIC